MQTLYNSVYRNKEYQKMKNNKSGIVIAGSLSPNKKVQDRVRVLSIWGGVRH